MKKFVTLGLTFGLLSVLGCGDPPKTPVKKDDKKPALTTPAPDDKKVDDKNADEKKAGAPTGEKEAKKDH